MSATCCIVYVPLQAHLPAATQQEFLAQTDLWPKEKRRQKRIGGTLSISHTKVGQKGFYRTEMFSTAQPAPNNYKI